jgi:hypothetical protein
MAVDVRRSLGGRTGPGPVKERCYVGRQMRGQTREQLGVEPLGEHLEHHLHVLHREPEAHALAPLGFRV